MFFPGSRVSLGPDYTPNFAMATSSLPLRESTGYGDRWERCDISARRIACPESLPWGDFAANYPSEVLRRCADLWTAHSRLHLWLYYSGYLRPGLDSKKESTTVGSSHPGRTFLSFASCNHACRLLPPWPTRSY